MSFYMLVNGFVQRINIAFGLMVAADKTLEALPNEGIKHLAVICPGFASDCLETIEEINMEGRESFIEAGGEQFHYIPCLNDDPAHIKALAKIVDQQLKR